MQGSYRTLEGGIYFQDNLAGGTNRRYGSQLWSVRLASVVSELTVLFLPAAYESFSSSNGGWVGYWSATLGGVANPVVVEFSRSVFTCARLNWFVSRVRSSVRLASVVSELALMFLPAAGAHRDGSFVGGSCVVLATSGPSVYFSLWYTVSTAWARNGITNAFGFRSVRLASVVSELALMFLPAAGCLRRGVPTYQGEHLWYFASVAVGVGAPWKWFAQHDAFRLPQNLWPETLASIRLASVVSELAVFVPACCGCAEWRWIDWGWIVRRLLDACCLSS